MAPDSVIGYFEGVIPVNALLYLSEINNGDDVLCQDDARLMELMNAFLLRIRVAESNIIMINC